jgi:AraC-like DNA-binding protein
LALFNSENPGVQAMSFHVAPSFDSFVSRTPAGKFIASQTSFDELEAIAARSLVHFKPAPRRPGCGLPKWRLNRVAAYIEANIEETVTLAGMAAAAGLSRMHFASQFRVATGVRPHEYLLRRRIERAQAMMLETRDPLIQIALGVGFQTQAHFTTVFRRFVGDTPYQWRCANSLRN